MKPNYSAKTATFTVNKADLPLTISSITRYDNTSNETTYVRNLSTGSVTTGNDKQRYNLATIEFANSTGYNVTGGDGELVDHVSLQLSINSATGYFGTRNAKSIVKVSSNKTKHYLAIHTIESPSASYSNAIKVVNATAETTITYYIKSVTVYTNNPNYNNITISCNFGERMYAYRNSTPYLI